MRNTNKTMKHSLIILILIHILFSFLLLSSPVIGQEIGVLYQYETSGEIKWEIFGDDKIQPKYKGKITNGETNGFGVLTYPYGEKNVIGEWKNGKEWNTKHTKKDGIIVGKFEKGEWILSWGMLYLGYRNGVFGWYEEKWEGVDSEDNKDIVKYEGEITNGVQDGQGTETYPDGSKYTGEYEDGKYNGQGTYTYPNGGKYEGEYKDGERNGQGTYTFPDGRKFVGEWKDGKINGQGTMTTLDGTKYEGEWKDEKPWNGIYYDKNENIIGKFVNGERIKQ